MGMFRQPAPDRNLGLVVDVLHVDKSLVWPGDCHAQDFPLAFDYGSDYGPEQTSEVENLLKFLPLFAEMDGVRILRVLLKHATAVCIAAHDLGKLPWCRRWMGGPTVNEFYKKGCQEKNSGATGLEILSRDPAHSSCTSLERFGWLSMLVSFSADGDDAVEFERATSEPVASKATMVLSEAHGLWLFLVIREGITCNG